jgi:hypothetical protein
VQVQYLVILVSHPLGEKGMPVLNSQIRLSFSGVDEGATLCVKPGKHGSIPATSPSDSESGERTHSNLHRHATKSAAS